MRVFLLMLLTLAGFYFISSKVFLGFGVSGMLLGNWVVLLQLKLTSGVLGIFLGVVSPVAAQVAHQANQFSLCILLCHTFSLRFIVLQSYLF